MDVRAIFGVSALLSFVSSLVIARLYVWPWLRTRGRNQALVPLVAPHMFLRFIGLSFLVPGVVSPALPAAFAVPAAYGDLVAGILAVIATIALAKRLPWAVAAVWLFNIWVRLICYSLFMRGRTPAFTLSRWEPRSTYPRQSCHSYLRLTF